MSYLEIFHPHNNDLKLLPSLEDISTIFPNHIISTHSLYSCTKLSYKIETSILNPGYYLYLSSIYEGDTIMVFFFLSDLDNITDTTLLKL